MSDDELYQTLVECGVGIAAARMKCWETENELDAAIKVTPEECAQLPYESQWNAFLESCTRGGFDPTHAAFRLVRLTFRQAFEQQTAARAAMN